VHKLVRVFPANRSFGRLERVSNFKADSAVTMITVFEEDCVKAIAEAEANVTLQEKREAAEE
jgi:hypothetical protein